MDSAILWYLAGVAVRSLCLFGLGWAAVLVLRVRTAAAEHAIWTAVLGGMVLLAALSPFAPPLPVHVLRRAPAVSVEAAPAAPTVAGVAPRPATTAVASTREFSFTDLIALLYAVAAAGLLIRLSFGYLFTRRLLRAAAPVELGPEPTFESTWISVPLTVGWLRPKIVLPTGWRDWEAVKLAAVLAHEGTHVRRGDWGIALLGGINRCAFWFHPGAWWLERRLATLAEQACDDAALLEMESRELYAQTLLDMAAAVRSGQGRLVWEAMAMARASEVRMRVERILDETRQIPRGLTRGRWAVLAACSLPLVYIASVLQLAPVRAQETPMQQGRAAVLPDATQLTAADVARMDQELTANPDDLVTRSRLIGYYFLHNIREPRLTHILWMIEHHPEADLTGFNSAGISPRANALNTIADYQRAAAVWQQQVAIHSNDPKVLANAAQFFSQPGGDWPEAERLLLLAGDTNRLGRLYVRALSGESDAAFAAQATGQLEKSTDALLLNAVSSGLRSASPPQHLELADRLLAHAQQFGAPPRPPGASPRVVESAGPKPVDVQEAPMLLSSIPAQYPAEAAPIRLSGIVRLLVTIGTDGRVTGASVMLGHPMLTESALSAVKQWVYSPVLEKGVPIVARFPVTVPFQAPGEPIKVAPAAAAGLAPFAAPERIRVGGRVQSASLIHSVVPVYPEQARAAGPDGGPLEGTVTLNVIIGKDGNVTNISPSAGHPLLEPAAEAAVKQFVYKPTLLNGNPVEVSTTVDVVVKP